MTCDIQGCKEKKTAGNIDVFRSEGWATIEIYGSVFEVCPEHEMGLRKFFFDTPESKD